MKLLILALCFVLVTFSTAAQFSFFPPRIDHPNIKVPNVLDFILPKKGNDKISISDTEKELLEACGSASSNKLPVNRNRTELTDYPWLALLQFENTLTKERKFLCGGALISERHVLTAAHCVTSPSQKLISARLGEHEVQVAEYIVHPDYNDGPMPRLDSDDPSDLAIVKLMRRVTFDDYARPVCLPRRPGQPGQRYEVAGWSVTMAPGAMPLAQMQRSELRGISEEECWSHRVNPGYSDDDHICAGGRSGELACVADAGGPLMAPEKRSDGTARMTVYGIGFMELPCSVSSDYSDMPGVFTKVHKYVSWIRKAIFPRDNI